MWKLARALHGRKGKGRAGQRALDFESLEPRLLLSAAQDQHGALPFHLPPQHRLQNTGGYLTGPSAANPLDIAVDYVLTHARSLGVAPADLAETTVTDFYTDGDTGTTHIYLRQRHNGLDIANAVMNINVDRDGRVINVGGGLVSGLKGLASGSNRIVAVPISAEEAVQSAANQLQLKTSTGPAVIAAPAAVDDGLILLAPGVSLDPIPARVQYVATPEGLQSAWGLVLRTPDGRHWYDLSVSQHSGQILHAADWTAHARYNVFAIPLQSPDDGPRTIEVDPHDPIASPFGWHDTNGVAGAEFTDTRGNNAHAQEDRNSNNSAGFRPDGGPSLEFDFPFDPDLSPTANQSAAITNLFYWSNILHDVHYDYGFTESAGNFQVNNYGRGGAGNDPLLADAQDGSGVNNADMMTPPDGQSPRTQMYLFDHTTPHRDAAFDSSIIIHEYGHGVSMRLTGGPSNSNSLSAIQSAGMAEGWSDWWALMFAQKSDDGRDGAYSIGTYAMGRASTGPGIRRQPYSFDMSVNPLTLGDFNSSAQIHDAGEIWASALWDLNWLLIEKHGFDPDISAGYSPEAAGNLLALKLVMDALKLQPANPTFLDGRDAILQADTVLTGAANHGEIWQAFARRGFGAGASVGETANSTTVLEAFDVPHGEPLVLTSSPAGAVIGEQSAMTFRFNQQMDVSSFSVADDVISFTGPGSADLRPQIIGFDWLDGASLRVSFATQSAEGEYEMVLGPQILSASGLQPLDQDRDFIPGEAPDDHYLASFTIDSCPGPDGFGYEACAHPFDSLDLVPGEPDVISILGDTDDDFASIPLGSNTFNFYGAIYTGSNQLYVSTNGLITFGSGSSEFNNGDLSDTPAQAAIAPLWDDWTTSGSTGGSTNDGVLYRFDVPTDRLIIEWKSVRHVSASGSATFQAILQLNTGPIPGAITFNYPDLIVGASDLDNGGSATVGIKADGMEGDRLLISLADGAHPLIGSGKAIRINSGDGPPRPAIITSHAPSGFAAPPVGFVDFSFSTAMDAESFSIEDDLARFFGPGGADLIPQITGFTWLDATTLRISFETQSVFGSYTIVLGPEILKADGMPMDQDADGVPGEPIDDRYVAEFAISDCVGPDAFGYRACPAEFESIDLVPGQSGVFEILDGADDFAEPISLGSNTFNFYGNVYTGSDQLFVSSNGLITFGSPHSTFNNSDLALAPPQASIAPLWDDWLADAADSGPENDLVLYRFDNDRLIIEWSAVRRLTAPTGEHVTFQAILQLNTGSAPGSITFNYVDLSVGSPSLDNGGSATVGIKNAGSQGPNRLLISRDDGNSPLLGSGRAIRITTGAATSAITGTEGDDLYVVQLDPAGAVVQVFTADAAAGDPAFSFPLDTLPSLAFETLGGNDTLIVDWINGNPIPPGGISYNAGNPAASADRLIVRGRGASTGAYHPAGDAAGAGRAELDGRIITFTGLGEVSASGFISFALITPNAPDLLEIASAAEATTITGASGGIMLTPLTFSELANLILDTGTNDAAGSGDDQIAIGPSGIAAGLELLTVRIGGGASNRLRIEGGTTMLQASGSSLTLMIGGSAVVDLAASHHLDELVITGSARASLAPGADKVLRTAGLSLTGDGVLDLHDNDLIVQATADHRDILLRTVEDLIASPRNSGGWDGPGITSSTARADVTRLTGLAVLLNQQSGSTIYNQFSGQSVDENSILVKHTWNGDLDLNGLIDIDDYFLIDIAFLDFQAGLIIQPTYRQGDLDFNDIVDIDDYFLIDTAFLGQNSIL